MGKRCPTRGPWRHSARPPKRRATRPWSKAQARGPRATSVLGSGDRFCLGDARAGPGGLGADLVQCPPAHKEDDKDADHNAYRREGVGDGLPVACQQVPSNGEPEDPWQAPKEREHSERDRPHLSYARRQAYKSPHQRDHAAEEDSGLAVFHEELLSLVQLAFPEQDVLAVAVEDRPTSGPADRVCHQGADEVASKAREDDPDKAQVHVRPSGAHTSCERTPKEHDGFTWYRDA